jgi:hypothetical protein
MKRALMAVWIILSAGLMVVLTASFVLTPESAARILPPCEWQVAYDRECPLCGMTRSFIHAARGELGPSLDANRAGLPLFLLFVANEAALGAALTARLAGRIGCRSRNGRSRKGASCRLQA